MHYVEMQLYELLLRTILLWAFKDFVPQSGHDFLFCAAVS